MPITPNAGDPLTARETEILELVAAGKGNRLIAQQLYLSEETIKAHMRHVFRKLGARDRAHAVALALRTGALAMPPGSTPRVLPAAAAGTAAAPLGKYASVTAPPGYEPIDYRGRGA